MLDIRRYYSLEEAGRELILRRKLRSCSKTGFCGVSQLKNGSFRSMIGFRKKKYHIGTFATIEEAVKARTEIENVIYGGFARAYACWKEKGAINPEWARKHPLEYGVEKWNGNFQVWARIGNREIGLK